MTLDSFFTYVVCIFFVVLLIGDVLYYYFFNKRVIKSSILKQFENIKKDMLENTRLDIEHYVHLNDRESVRVVQKSLEYIYSLFESVKNQIENK